MKHSAFLNVLCLLLALSLLLCGCGGAADESTSADTSAPSQTEEAPEGPGPDAFELPEDRDPIPAYSPETKPVDTTAPEDTTASATEDTSMPFPELVLGENELPQDRS